MTAIDPTWERFSLQLGQLDRAPIYDFLDYIGSQPMNSVFSWEFLELFFHRVILDHFIWTCASWYDDHAKLFPAASIPADGILPKTVPPQVLPIARSSIPKPHGLPCLLLLLFVNWVQCTPLAWWLPFYRLAGKVSGQSTSCTLFDRPREQWVCENSNCSATHYILLSMQSPRSCWKLQRFHLPADGTVCFVDDISGTLPWTRW